MNQSSAAHALPTTSIETQVCVVGGGMSGLCAAVASARNGASTLLIQDRPVLGGNASSEVRMWICGAHGKYTKETGILEEIQLDNHRRNLDLNYSVWDSVLWAKAVNQPNLTLWLNTSVCGGKAQQGRLESITAWQLTSQRYFTVCAQQFVDCSGDSILAPISGASTRCGRESSAEFDEDIAPLIADRRTMGNTILLQIRKTDKAQPFVSPDWATRIEGPEDLPHRINGVKAHNFWWLEIGGMRDTISDAESISRDLYRLAWGVWDYIKNRAPEREDAECWALEWLGSLPGKRENLRYIGDHTLAQHDVRSGSGRFDDVVAYGGWAMDDHHPAGIFYPGPPTLFHPAPSPYDIPYRSLYSHNVDNLLCAGRNISATHVALSSTRVMATCSLLGQAVGTAAALSVRHNCSPRALSSGERLGELQQTLMEDDVWLPGRSRAVDPLATSAKPSAVGGEGASRLADGIDRDLPKEPHGYRGQLGVPILWEWNQPENIEGLRLVLDSNLADDKRMPCSYPQANRSRVPATLLRRFRIEAVDTDGRWETVHIEPDNHQRLVYVPVGRATAALRLIPESTWGVDEARIFSCEPLAKLISKRPAESIGQSLSELRQNIPADELRPSAQEMSTKSRGAGAPVA